MTPKELAKTHSLDVLKEALQIKLGRSRKQRIEELSQLPLPVLERALQIQEEERKKPRVVFAGDEAFHKIKKIVKRSIKKAARNNNPSYNAYALTKLPKK